MTFVVLLSTILMTYVAYYYYKYFTRANPLPGPFPFPLVDTFPQIFLKFNGNIVKFYKYCYEKYGDIYEINAGIRSIVLCRPEYLESFLSKNAYGMRYKEGEELKELGIKGKGVAINNDFKLWSFNRHFYNQAILSPKFTNEVIDRTNKLFNELESYWDKLFLKEEIIKENKNKLDFTEWLNHYSHDMMIRLLTGTKSYSMAGYCEILSDEKSDLPSVDKDSVEFVIALRKQMVGYWIFFVIPAFLRRNVPFFKKMANNVLQNLQFVEQKLNVIVKKRRQEIRDTPLDKPLPHDMLTSMIIKNTLRDANYIDTGEANRTMTDSEICANLREGILSGTQKCANSLSLIVYYIAHNPDVKRKMLEEIDKIFQGDKMRPITKDDYYSLSYCEAIVKEVGRIFPVNHTVSRWIDKPEEVIGYQWPADTLFIINITAVHNNENYWEEPNKFNPDRWMVENFEPKKNSFIMFGGGLRICPGSKLGMIELVCLMVLLYRKYELDLVDMNSPIKISCDGVLVACEELLVEIKPRN